MKKCATCGGRLSRTRKDEVHEVAGRRFVATLPSRSCRACGTSFLDAPTIERVELEVACELAQHGPACGETFRYMRKALGMRAVALARLLGVTPETVSRWENEQRPVDGATWIALGSVVLEKARRAPSTLERLRALQSPAPPVRPVRIVVASPGRP